MKGRFATVSCIAGLAICVTVVRGGRAGTLNVEFYGMIGFAPTTDQKVLAVLVNALDNPVAKSSGMRHFPMVELKCGDLVDSAMQRDCLLWPHSAPDPEYRTISLGEGWDLRVLDTSGPVDLTSSFKNETVILGAIPFLADGARTLHPLIRQRRHTASTAPALKDLAAARMLMSGGKLDADAPDPRGPYRIYSTDRTKHYDLAISANRASYTVKVVEDIIVVQLTSYDQSKAMTLALRSIGVVTIRLVNEPTIYDFCMAEPSPGAPAVKHFTGIYSISAAAAPEMLPVPEAIHAEKKQCYNKGDRGREPIICMRAVFGEFKYE